MAIITQAELRRHLLDFQERKERGEEKVLTEEFAVLLMRLASGAWRKYRIMPEAEFISCAMFQFLRRSLHSANPERNLFNFFTKCAVNAARRSLATELAAKALPKRYQRPVMVEFFDTLEAEEHRLAFNYALRTIPPKARMLFILHDMEGVGILTAARHVRTTTPKAKKLIELARRRLRRSLGSYLEIPIEDYHDSEISPAPCPGRIPCRNRISKSKRRRRRDRDRKRGLSGRRAGSL